MKLIKFLLPALIVMVVACKHKSNNEPVASVPNSQDSVSAGSFLPVAEFIKSDITRVDSFSGGILRKANTNGKKDSSYIQLPQFHQLANQFLLPELDSASFHEHFTESSMMDETTEMLNFIYTPKQADWPLRKVMVYISPATTGDKVNRIYMEREFNRGDTAFHQKFTWKTGAYFYIISLQQPNHGPAVTSMEKVIWDPQYFSED
jgi:hypothetical protein